MKRATVEPPGTAAGTRDDAAVARGDAHGPRNDLLGAWYRRRATIIAVLLILAVLAAAALRAVQLGPARVAGPAVFSVSIEYFGVDAEEMERLVTIPLEDAIAPLTGLQRLRSTSEYGKSTVEVTLSTATAPDRFYLSLRDAVNALYVTLPRAAQRPEIQSAASDQRPCFIATVTVAGLSLDETRDYVESSIKPALERIEGVGDVEAGGGSQREVHVVADERRLATAGLSFDALASLLQAQHLARPVGRLRSPAADTPVVLDGRFDSLRGLAALPLSLGSGRVVRLGDLAEVSFSGRELDAISRIDGERRVIVAIRSAGAANVVALSTALRRQLAELGSGRVAFGIVYDLGGDIAAAIDEVLWSLAIAMAVVALFVSVALRPAQNALLLTALLPFVVLASVAALSVLGISVDQNILAGVGVGIGMIVDPGIIVLSTLSTLSAVGRAPGLSTARAVRELFSPLVASTATILIVLVPLFSLGRTVSGLTEVSSALALMLTISLAVAVLLLPAFAGRGNGHRATGALASRGTIAARTARRFLGAVVLWSSRHALFVLAGTAVVCALGIVGASRMDLVLVPAADAHSVFVHVEFKSGTSIDSIDARTAQLTRAIDGMKGVEHVESTARRESSQVTVTMTGNPADAAAVRAALVHAGAAMADAFVYLPEGTGAVDQAVEVSVLGPDNAVLRDSARQAASVFQVEPWVSQVVLNFKDGPPSWVLAVDHDTLSQYGLSVAAIASTLRWSMYGPVALKWLQPDSREIDLRIQGGSDERGNLAAIQRTPVLGQESRIVSVGNLGTFQREQPPSRIFRLDRQRAVSLTVHSGLRDTGDVLSKLQRSLGAVSLPAGYAFLVDKGVYDSLDQVRTLAFLLLGALVLVFITLAAQMESLSSPLLVMSIVPVSLSVPVFFLWATRGGITVSVIVSLIIMSGIIVNNAILVVDRTLARCASLESYTAGEVLRSLRYAIRRRTRALLLTSGSTVLGVAPFLFAVTGSELFRPLAVVVLWGTIASISATFLVLPAVAAAAPVFARRFPAVKN